MYCTAHLIYGCSWIWLNAQSVCRMAKSSMDWNICNQIKTWDLIPV